MGYTVHRAAIAIAAGFACAAPLAAVDHDVANGYVDLRLGYTFADVSYEGTVHGATDTEFKNDWDENHRVWLDLIGSPGLKPHGGVLFGVRLVSDWRDKNADNDDVDVEYRAWAGHLQLGYGLPIGDAFQLELVPFGGLGISEARREGDKSQDTLIEYGADLNAVLTLNWFQLGASVGYLLSDSESALRSGSGTSADYDFKDGVVTWSGFLGIRF